MIEVEALTVTVYRSKVGREKRFRRKAAYLDAAWFAWKAKYPCTCDPEKPQSYYECKAHKCGDDYECGLCRDDEWADYRRKVIGRLARWLMWRDSKRKAA
jgi:hypothetical protein